MQEILWKKHPDRAASQAAQDAALAQFFQQKNKKDAASGGSMTLPVVVHIVHNGGSENISDAQVLAAIQHLNAAFAHADYFGQAGEGVDVGVQYCLARRTPDGQPTTGITRIQSALTKMDMETDDLPLKNLDRWDPTRYVNVWVVQSINSLSSGPGVAGYAYFPSSHGKPEDGMVCEAQFFGVDPKQDAVLIHEMGHYLGLYHTFESGCKNDDCLTDGDRVCDTPPDQAKHTACPFNSCHTDTDAPAPNPLTSDVNDMTENFMDYSPFDCVYRFTQGQSERMQQSVKTTRASLLQSNGCEEACNPLVKADFLISPPGGGVAGVVANFQNKSTGATSYEWWIDGTLISSAVHTTQAFNFPGVYVVQLKASNGQSACADSFSTTYVVTCPVKAAFTADKTNIKTGETIAFSSTATGGGSLEWWINGLSVGSGSTLNFTFPNEGIYTVVLRATDAVCSDEFSMQIEVVSDCAQQMEPVQYSAPYGLAFLDMQTLSNGNVLACGTANLVKNGAVVLFDAKGNPLWSKKTGPEVVVWSDLRALPDGSFALLGRGNVGGIEKPSVTHIDANGNVLRFLTFTYAAPGAIESFNAREQLVLDADGSLTATVSYGNGDLMAIKFKMDGSLQWSKKFTMMYQSDLVKPDGTSGYLLGRTIEPIIGKGKNYEVFRLDANGVVTQAKSYQPTTQLNWQAHNSPRMQAHPDGGYAIVSMTNSLPAFKTNVMRCSANGDIVWSNHYLTAGVNSHGHDCLSYFKGKGWLLNDQGSLSNDPAKLATTLLRIEEDGSLKWNKKFTSSSPVIGWERTIAGEQAGHIRLIANDGFVGTPLLGSLPDANGSAECINQTSSTTVLTQQYTHDVINASPLIYNDFPVTLTTDKATFTDLLLTKIAICAVPPVCPETCDNGKDDDGDGYVDCYDPDCQCFDDEDCLANNLDPDVTIEGVLSWKSPLGTASWIASPLVANLNPKTDAIPEVIAVVAPNPSKLNIFKGDGSNASNPDELSLPNGFAWNGNYPVIGDVDRDGSPELILIEQDQKVRVYRNFVPNTKPCMTLWITSDLPAGNAKDRPMLADFDQDGQTEVFAGNDVFKFDFSNPANPQLRRVLDGTGPLGYFMFTGNNVSTAADMVSPADCNGDPDCNGLELVAGYVIYSVDVDLLDGDGYQIKAVKNLNTMQSTFIYQDGCTSVADVDLDGIPDVIVGAPRQGGGSSPTGMYVWNKNGLVRYLTLTGIGGSFRGVQAIANVYDDKKSGYAKDYPEILVCGVNQLACINLNKAAATPAIPYWWNQSNTDDSGYTGCSIFDFNGDGLQEIVYRDQSDLRILYGGAAPFPPGVDAQRNWWKTTVGSVTFDEFPVVADVDNDGRADIAVIGKPVPFVSGSPAQPYNGQLSVFKSANIPWMPCRPIWNQFNYNHVNVNDDLSIPAHQQKHWLEFPGPGGGKYPFNTALTQISPLNSKLLPGYPVPDASVKLDTFYCIQNTLNIRLRVCNTGSASLPDKTPLQLYTGDPNSSTTNPIGLPLLLPGKLEKDSCRIWNLTIPMPSSGSLWGVLNDNGSLKTPFNPTQQLPSTQQPECNYANNAFNLNASFAIPSLDLGPDQSLCSSSTSTLQATAGFARYRWQDGSTGSTFTAFGPGKYWVDAWDVCGGQYSDTVRIAQTVLAIELGPDQTICSGDSIALAVSGFDQVSWSSASKMVCSTCPQIRLEPDTSTMIRVTGQIGNCFVSDSVRIEVQAAPVLTDTSIIQPACFGDKGQISVTLSGGAQPYEYRWDGTPGSSTFSSSGSGPFHLVVSSANGCSNTAVFNLSEPAALALSTTMNAPSCTSATADIYATAQGGTPPYSFLWNTSATSPDLLAAPTGSYQLTVTDAKGCSRQSLPLVVEPGGTPMLTDSVLTPIRCFGDQNGQIAVTLSGGAPPYEYRWDGVPGMETLSNIGAGAYQLVASGANGCSVTAVFNLSEPPPLALSTSMDSSSCTRVTADLHAVAQGGVPPYAFLWNTSATSPDLLAAPTGSYQLTVTDAKGCSRQSLPLVVEPGGTPMLTDSVLTPIRCFGDQNGQIAVTLSGGAPPYEYRWDGVPGMETLSNIGAGAYQLVASGANGCSVTAVFNLSEPPPLALSTSMDSSSCTRVTADLHAVAQGGVPPYAFLWNTTAGTPDLLSVAPGTYLLTLTDANGCSRQSPPFVVEPGGTPMLTDSVFTPIRCFGDQNGQIAVTLSGGVPPYDYKWSGVPGSNTLSNLGSGTYQLVASGANGCSVTAQFVLNSPAMLVVQQVVSPDSCTRKTGAILTAVQGGTPPYQFLWSDNQTLAQLTQLPSGTWTLTLTDANGCTATQTSVVDAFGLPPVFSLTGDTLSCTKKAIDISASPVSLFYKWQSPGGGQLNGGIQTITQAGWYEVTATNASGCSGQKSLWIPIDTLSPALPPLPDVVQIACGQPFAVLDATAAAGNPLLDLHWQRWAGNQPVWDTVAAVIQVPIAGHYRLVIQNLRNGCSASDTVQVLPFVPITALLVQADSVSCWGAQDGRIVLGDPTGGTPPFVYAIGSQPWGPQKVFEPLTAGIYTVTVQDAAGCTFQQTIAVGTPELLAVHLTVSDSLVAKGSSVQLNAQVMPPGAFLTNIRWEPASLPSQLAVSTTVDAHTLSRIQVEDAHGCKALAEARVRVREAQVFIPNVIYPGKAQNGVLTAFGAEELSTIKRFQVYDRWGTLLFDEQNVAPNNPDAGWAGQYKGQPVAEGVYVYVMLLAFSDGSEEVFSGDVTVVR